MGEVAARRDEGQKSLKMSGLPGITLLMAEGTMFKPLDIQAGRGKFHSTYSDI